jgi:DNA repair protein RecN (Recombination protein N)
MALIELSVENLAVIEAVRLRLSPGFTAVTGETGAGKSLVVDAVALALGARATADQVRSGSDGTRIEAIFDAPPSEPDDPLSDLLEAGEGLLIVRREVAPEGRSLARLNDRTVTVGSLAALGSRLGEIHGQHEQQRLLEPDRQLALLDRFGAHGALRTTVEGRHGAWRSAMAAASELMTDPQELARRIELLSHQAEEIGGAGLRPGEDEALEGQLRAADHAEAVARGAGEAVRALGEEGGALDAAHIALRSLEQAAAHDERFAPLVERAHAVTAEAEELARDARQLGEQVELDPASRAALEARLALIYELKRKYGSTIEAVVAFGERAAAELEELADQDGLRARLRDEEAATRDSLEHAAAQLRAARRIASADLEQRVNAELPPLGLPAGSFAVVVTETEIGFSGGDRVGFTFAPNPGEPPRPLARIASGGESSRLSLAIKVVLAGADETGLLVFDEVDAGIGGRNAAALGERLRDLSRFHQVLCVTHLPQVAAFADTHLVVGKQVAEGRTYTEVRELTGAERASELAAMLGGKGAAEAHAAAEALLRGAAR